MPRTLALSLICVALATPVTADIYRWTDPDGTVHFSDRPPSHRSHSSVELATPVIMPMSENIRQADRVEKSRAAVGRLLAPANRDRYAGAGEDPKHAAQCQNYRRQLDRLQSQLRAGYASERGNSLRQKRRQLSQLYSRECMLN
ncbi:MAG TPA: DUF4124 domain-containing protein [Marinobacter sp.]|nr:DUF4124 domain-containing protein [Marinobacter sp.]